MKKNTMLKTKLIAALCAVLMLLAGCSKGEDSPADDFLEESVAELPTAEYLSAKTELNEYDGNIEKIFVTVTNDSDKEFPYDNWWRLEKEADGEWRTINLTEEIYVLDFDVSIPAHSTVTFACELKGHIKQPLPSGHYRLWVGGRKGRAPAEFTIKE